MSAKKTAERMIAHLKVAVNIPNISQSFPNLEFPDNTLPVVGDSILSFLARLEVPGLSSMFPLMAAPGVGTLMSGAASSLEGTR